MEDRDRTAGEYRIRSKVTTELNRPGEMLHMLTLSGMEF